jgi:hypothetical protein
MKPSIQPQPPLRSNSYLSTNGGMSNSNIIDVASSGIYRPLVSQKRLAWLVPDVWWPNFHVSISAVNLVVSINRSMDMRMLNPLDRRRYLHGLHVVIVVG